MLRAPFAHIFVLIAFLVNTFGPIPAAYAQDFHLPAPGVMVHLSPPLDPPILKGLKVHPDNPFRFDFILDKGEGPQQEQLKAEATKLIKYFLASLTIPEKDLWVNLSPYEKDRIIPQSFGLTEMGRDLLAEDYMLKQITASLIYPEDEIGKKFWKRVYEEAQKKFGTTNIPVNTFNKVWIIPEKAVVYENAKAGTAYVVESRLKVMLEEDYLSMSKHVDVGETRGQDPDINKLGSDIVREIVIPELTREVNENKNFAKLRQVYNSLILATWYKKKIKDSILSQVYANQSKVAGVNIDDPQEKDRIYRQYLRAFKKGVYNYIKEEVDPLTQETMPRKYFSGGFALENIAPIIEPASSDQAMAAVQAIESNDHALDVEADVDVVSGGKIESSDFAMASRSNNLPQFKVGPTISEKQRFINHSYTHLNQLLLQKTFLPANHPARQYLSQLLQSLVRKKSAEVLVYVDDDVEAFALPNGHIILSTGAVRKLMTTEEAAAALFMHELIHIEKDHSYRGYVRGPSIDTVGIMRAFEMEADLNSMTELDERGVNPIGTLTLQENIDKSLSDEINTATDPARKKELELIKEFEPTHGTALQRKSNLRELTRFVNFMNLKEEQHPIDWQAFGINGAEENTVVSGTGHSNYDLLNRLGQQVKENKEVKTLLLTMAAKGGLELSDDELSAIQEVLRMIVKGKEDTEGVETALNPSILLSLFERNIFDKLGLPLSARQLISLVCESTKVIFQKASDAAPSVADLNSLKLLLQVVAQYYQERFLDGHSFIMDLNTAFVGNYIVLTKRLREVPVKQTEIMDHTGDEEDRPFSEISFLGAIPSVLISETTAHQIVSVLPEPILNFDNLMDLINSQLGFHFMQTVEAFKGYAFNDENEKLFSAYLADLADTLSLLYREASVFEDHPAYAKTQNSLTRFIWSDWMFGGIKTSEGEERGELRKSKFGLYNYLSTKGIISNSINPPTQSLAKEVLSWDENKFQQAVLDATQSQGLDNKQISNGIVELLYEFENTLELEQNRRGNTSLDPRELTKKEYHFLIMLNIFTIRSKEEILSGINRIQWDDIDSGSQAESLIDFIRGTVEERNRLPWPPIRITNRDISAQDHLLGMIKIGFLQSVEDKKAGDILRGAVKLIQKYPVLFQNAPEGRGGYNELKDNENEDIYNETWHIISEKVSQFLSRHPPTTSADFEQILALVLLSQNNIYCISVVSTSLKEMVARSKGFQEAFNYLKAYDFLPSGLLGGAVNELLKKHAKSIRELDIFYSWFRQELDTFLHSPNNMIKLEAIQGALHLEKKEDRIEFIKGALLTYQSDERLKRYAGGRWQRLFNKRILNLSNVDQVMFYAYQADKRKDERSAQQAAFMAAQPPEKDWRDLSYFDSTYSGVFQLNALTRYLLLRAIALEGEDALFRSKEAKEEIVNYFIETYMKLNPEDKESPLAKNIRDIIAQDLDPEDLFYFIGPAMSDMILQVPAHSYPTQKITDDLFELFLREPPEYLYKRYQDFFDLARLGDRKALMQAFPGTVKILKLRLKSYVTGKMPILKYDQNNRLTAEEPKRINYTNFEDSALEMLQPYIEKHATFQKQVTPVELSVEVAKKTGGLAVRLLQLFGMFFKLSSDDRLTLSQVYDDVEGQNKLQFYEQVKRYAAVNPKFKAIFEKIKEILNMLGGGSIVTVYEATDEDGHSQAVGVNNPNVEFRAGEFKKFGDVIIDGLVRRNPDNRDYQILKKLWNDSYQWLLNEVNDSDFVAKNNEFIEQNDHRSNDPNAFKAAEGAPHQIAVPEIVDTGVPQIRWMRKISGPTLNKESLYNLEIAKKEGRTDDVKRLQEELKPTIALIAQNFLHQLDQLLVHSDIHPGQFIDEDGTHDLNVLDTKNLLRLNKEDMEQGQLILKNLFKQHLQGKDITEEGQEFVRKFLQEYDLTNADSRNKLFKDLLGDMEGKSPEEVLQELLWRGQQKMDIPLKWTLILKNIVNINRLSQDVGFAHIGEAIMYGIAEPGQEIDAGKVLGLARRLMPNFTRDFILPEMIGGWKGKALSTFIRSDELAERVGAKAKAWLNQLRSLQGDIDPQVRDQVNAWFNKLKDGEPFSIQKVSQRMNVPENVIKEIISRGITQVIGKGDTYIKNEAKINGGLTGFHLAQSTALKSTEGDEAMATRKGGIDLTPANMNLQTQNKDGEIKFHIDPAQLAQLQNASGFVPVIINIQPMNHLSEFLGLK